MAACLAPRAKCLPPFISPPKPPPSPSCPQRTAACEGQVVRLERAAKGMDSWSVHVVHMEGEDAEPDQEEKLELR